MDKDSRRFLLWLSVFALLAAGFTLFVTLNNDTANDVIFVAETWGISFCVSIISSLIVIFFFSRRDQRMRDASERGAARRVALEIVRYLRVKPHQPVQVLRDKLEYLLDTLQFALDDDIKHDIERFLHTTEDDAIGADLDKAATNNIDTIVNVLKNRYGEGIFSTTRGTE
ncbi:MAG: hypothetical protein LBM12_00375 [Candidatus Nomurabacteria bacterium]|jgi:hypothetical protein|nr:hypothetical protein [Candidatus Nomurabacteria bacterium]